MLCRTISIALGTASSMLETYLPELFILPIDVYPVVLHVRQSIRGALSGEQLATNVSQRQGTTSPRPTLAMLVYAREESQFSW